MEAYDALAQHVDIKKVFPMADSTDFKIYVLLTRYIIFSGWFFLVMTKSVPTLT